MRMHLVILLLWAVSMSACKKDEAEEAAPTDNNNTTTQGDSLKAIYSDADAIFVCCNRGVPPYTYAWEDGPITADRFNLGSNTYAIVVTDANQCIHSPETFFLNEPERSDWTMFGNTRSNPLVSYIWMKYLELLFLLAIKSCEALFVCITFDSSTIYIKN